MVHNDEICLFNTFRPETNNCNFADDIFKLIFYGI